MNKDLKIKMLVRELLDLYEFISYKKLFGELAAFLSEGVLENEKD
jgi:hypothetical protein